MRKLTKKWQMLLYAMGGMGVNLLNLMVGTYLCSAIAASGFKNPDLIPNHTFYSNDLVYLLAWGVFGTIAKIIDGVIDVPMASFTDNLKSKFGRRRPALIIGLIPMILAYALFAGVTPNPAGAAWSNMIFYFVVLVVFYCFYTLTMVTYYATFTEIVETQEQRNFISNVKSVCDIVYFILGFVVVSAMLKGMNIRLVALLVLPMVLTMLIPLFLIKENSTKDGVVTDENGKESKPVNLIKSIAYTFKNKNYIIWMCVYSFMTFGVQLFLSGINEYFAATGMEMMFVMMAAFGPVPLTLLLYNWITRRFGFGVSFRYTLCVYAVGMLAMFGVSLLPAGTLKMVLAICTGLISSLGIGAMFSVAYSIPSEMAAEEEKKTGVSNAAMYFAVQGLFSAVATGIGGYFVLNALKKVEHIEYMTPICAAAMVVSFILSFFLPKYVRNLGKKSKK